MALTYEDKSEAPRRDRCPRGHESMVRNDGPVRGESIVEGEGPVIGHAYFCAVCGATWTVYEGPWA